jgi:hypothetical protein
LRKSRLERRNISAKETKGKSAIGARKGDHIHSQEGDKLIVQPVSRVVDLLKEPATVKISLEEFHKSRRELSKRAESSR